MKKAIINLEGDDNQAKMMAYITLQMEKFYQVKEHFFASKFNLTPTEFRCMRFINDEVVINTKTLAKQMRLTPGRITHLLNSLERKRLLTRTIDKKDRRSIQVRLTFEAIAYIDKIIDEYIKLHEEILKYLPEERKPEIINNMKFFFTALIQWSEKLN